MELNLLFLRVDFCSGRLVLGVGVFVLEEDSLSFDEMRLIESDGFLLTLVN
jgi:hypothetical protein